MLPVTVNQAVVADNRDKLTVRLQQTKYLKRVGLRGGLRDAVTAILQIAFQLIGRQKN
jgi:hypothetical protein